MNTDMIVKLSEKGVDRAVGRVVGIHIKDEILKEFHAGDFGKIVLDFTEIDFVTSGFAKELLGGLYESFGNAFVEKVSIRVDKGDETMKNNIKRALATAIAQKK